MKTYIALLFALAFAASAPAPAQSTMAPLLTRAWDNHRSGWNQQETVLTQANVKAQGITHITTIPVVGDARGVESQPLILPGVKLADGTTHNVMILPSMANVVRGVDATTGAGLWQTPPLGTPITGSDSLGPNGPGAMCPGANQTIDCYQINDSIGASSPPASSTLKLGSSTSSPGSRPTARRKTASTICACST